MAAQKPPILTPQADDFPRWYQDVISKAQLAENGPVRGTMVIRPVGYAIWEQIVAGVDARIKRAGAENAYFPVFIPQEYLAREAEHVEGFSPELAVVTHAGGKQVEEPFVVRPTSETVIGEFMAKWTQSYRDLPLLLNQWANVVRWELRPRIFLRTSEFLWQEGHTAHATESEARNYARQILHDVYEDFIVNVLACPAIVGRKTSNERFAGATDTYTLEGMMRDGKALQLCTSHELGQNFAKAFNIQYLTASGYQEYAWTTSWGSTTRMIGGVIMTHGDNNGLRLPPRLAPVQVLVTVVKDGEGVAEVAAQLHEELRAAGIRAKLDTRTDIPFGRRAVDAELQGIPVRIELGPRDLTAGNVVLVQRITSEKSAVPIREAATAVRTALDVGQQTLRDQATEFRDKHIVDVSSLDEAVAATGNGWARLRWSAVGPDGEATLNQQGVSVRCLVRPDGTVPESDNEPDLIAYIARAY